MWQPVLPPFYDFFALVDLSPSTLCIRTLLTDWLIDWLRIQDRVKETKIDWRREKQTETDRQTDRQTLGQQIYRPFLGKRRQRWVRTLQQERWLPTMPGTNREHNAQCTRYSILSPINIHNDTIQYKKLEIVIRVARWRARCRTCDRDSRGRGFDFRSELACVTTLRKCMFTPLCCAPVITHVLLIS